MPPWTAPQGRYEFLVVAAVTLLVFGNRLPGVAKTLGKGVTRFQKSIHGDHA